MSAFLDDLARALARSPSRRGALRVAAGVIAAGFFPDRAQACNDHCPPNRTVCNCNVRQAPGTVVCNHCCCPPDYDCVCSPGQCACAPRRKCGSVLCAAGELCCNSAQNLCCRSTETCGHRDGKSICCRAGYSTCGSGGAVYCCGRPDERCTPEWEDGTTKASTNVCCPPERQISSGAGFIGCCPEGQVQAPGGRFIIGQGLGGLCCPKASLCGAGATATCCPDTRECCGSICCPTSAACCNRACCQPGQACCKGMCVTMDTRTDPHNCGGCGIICGPSMICRDGKCILL